MLVPGQRMTDQDRVGAVDVGLAIGLVSDVDLFKPRSAIKRQRPQSDVTRQAEPLVEKHGRRV